MQDFAPLKNDLLLRALEGSAVERPPVWMMRQAGRYLPDFMKLREKHSFFERCETPELATEITLMPVDQVGVDAAIIFSDILVIPQALDMDVTIEPGEGPRIHNPVRTPEQVDALRLPDVADRLSYVMEALTMTRRALGGRVPLIGFAGAPWTILCYMVEGQGSKNFLEAKKFCLHYPEAAHKLLDLIARATTDYLNAQVAAGAQVVQIFDTWAGLLDPHGFQAFSLPYLKQILDGVEGVPRIVFARGAWYALKQLSDLGCEGLSLSWQVPPRFARSAVAPATTLQGNLDPADLFSTPEVVRQRTHTMIRQFGTQRFIANLGHGILPKTPVENAKAFIDAVKSFES